MNNNWKNPDIFPFGEVAILVSWETEIEGSLLDFMLNTKKTILKDTPNLSLEITNTYNSLLIIYPFPINDFYGEKSRLLALIDTVDSAPMPTDSLVSLPVCYDKKFGLDMKAVSAEKNLSFSEIISLHSSMIYTVYFIGFLPGFPYLGKLDDRLRVSRKKEPRPQVKKGAVGLAEIQTGIYPRDSAGGWQLIGNCPLDLFDPSKKRPSLLRAGDKVKFRPVSVNEHEAIKAKIADGTYKLEIKSSIV